MKHVITFYVSNMYMGFDIEYVREITKIDTYTKVFSAPESIKGLINLRGDIVTIIDLGKCFGSHGMKCGDRSCNIILKNQTKDSNNYSLYLEDDIVGLLVDKLGNTECIEELDIESPPANISGIPISYVDGVISHSNEMMIIINVANIIDDIKKRT